MDNESSQNHENHEEGESNRGNRGSSFRCQQTNNASLNPQMQPQQLLNNLIYPQVSNPLPPDQMMELIVMLLLLMINQPRQGSAPDVSNQVINPPPSSSSIESIARNLLSLQASSSPPSPNLVLPFLQQYASLRNPAPPAVPTSLGQPVNPLPLGAQLYRGSNSNTFSALPNFNIRPAAPQLSIEDLLRVQAAVQLGNVPSPPPTLSSQGVSAAEQQPASSPSRNTKKSIENDSSRPLPGAKKQKREHDMPVRPRTAYNFFFQEQREAILRQSQNRADLKRQADDVTVDCQKLSSRGNDNVHDDADDEDRKPPAKLPCEQVGFQELGKIIGNKWQTISPEAKAKYQSYADKDRQRYNEEMKVWKQRRQDELTLRRAELENLVDPKTREEYLKSGGEISKTWRRKDDDKDEGDGDKHDE